jgi:hypothetical protein
VPQAIETLGSILALLAHPPVATEPENE